jgi:hypothetical protein
MPKFKRPKKGCGLNLRGVIEGELMLWDYKLDYAEVGAIVNAIEKRIQDGPSDWLSLSDGTTFDKSWVPEERESETTYNEKLRQVKARIDSQEPPQDRVSKFGRNLHENLIQTIQLEQEDKLGALGHDSNRLLVESLHNISSEHDKRVAAHKLEKEIQAHEAWLEYERENRLK